jgi:hypothetical protein
MKFKCTVAINRNIQNVSEAFQDPEVMKACQEGLIEIIHLSGEKGKKGSTAKIVYEKMELIETIIENNLPDIFFAEYDHKHTNNTMKVTFKEISPTKTEYYTEIEYLEFKGFIVKLMAKIAPSFFKKQVLKWMKRFKQHLETK